MLLFMYSGKADSSSDGSGGAKQNPAVDCPWCGQWTRLDFVHGHYQCSACHRVVYNCCDGEQAE